MYSTRNAIDGGVDSAGYFLWKTWFLLYRVIIFFGNSDAESLEKLHSHLI